MNKLMTARTWDFSATIGKMVAPQRARSLWLCYGLAVALPLSGFVLNWLAFDLARAPYFSLFMATVVITALVGGRGPGLVNTVISTMLGFLVAPPAWTLRLSESEDGIRIALFAVLGCLISIIVGIVGELQRKLIREQSTLAAILHTIGDAVITTNQHGHIESLNDVAKVATGWELRDAVGRSVDEVARIVDGRSRETVPNPVRLTLESRTVVDRVSRCFLIRSDGTEIPIVYSAACIDSRYDGVPGVVLVFRDVSKLTNTYNALVRTEKLATVGKLASALAHEVNSPLEAICNLLFLIQSASDLEFTRSKAKEALHQTLRVAHIVQRTLAFVKPSDRRQQVDIGPLIDQVLSLYSNKIVSKNAQVLKDCASGIAIHASPSELEQVISNLISNALDAIGYEGTLHLRMAQSNGTVHFVIADTGYGISQQHISMLFDGFFTTKPKTNVGLGLWAAKQIVDAHGGRIRLRSCEGRGTVVRVSLPAIDQPSSIEIEEALV